MAFFMVCLTSTLRALPMVGFFAHSFALAVGPLGTEGLNCKNEKPRVFKGLLVQPGKEYALFCVIDVGPTNEWHKKILKNP